MASYAYLRWRRETEAECGFMVGMGITSPSAWAADHEGTDYGLPPTMCATMRFWFGPQQ